MPPASGNGIRIVRDEGYVVVDNLPYFDSGKDNKLKRFRGRPVRVFPDVIHPGLVYIFVNSVTGWITGRSIYADFFALYSKREIQGVMAELKLGKLRGVRDPVVTSVALAEKLLELERDPARKDTLAKQLEMLLNRAPSLFETETNPEAYFNPPPSVGSHSPTDDSLGTSSSSSSVKATSPAAVPDEADKTSLKTEPVSDSGPERTVPTPDGSPEDDDVEPVIRPTRLSF